ncbi:MAG: DUF421 domain-containing protein [Ignavibacteria bacterium]|nr:DUF421 domain-containing protein [Ignavibacteria bacterium]
MSLLEVAGASAALYILIMICLRLLGKKGLGEISIPDLVLIILIGEALGSLIPQENAFISAIVCIVTLGIINFALERAVFYSKSVRKAVDGEPVLLVKDGRVLKANMEKEKVTMGNLKEALRSNGLTKIEEVKIAVLETDGEISIIENSKK